MPTDIFGGGERVKLDSPLTMAELDVLPESITHVQFDEPMSESSYETLGRWFEHRPDVMLRIYGGFPSQFADLTFLKYFSKIRRVDIDPYKWSDFDSLQHLSADLEILSVGDSLRSKRFSLQMLTRFKNLKCLSLGGTVKHPESLVEFQELTELGLHGGPVRDLTMLAHLPKLKSLTITGGAIDVTPLRQLVHLETLMIGQLRNCPNIDFLSQLKSLKALEGYWLPNVKSMPSLETHKSLRKVKFETMKGLVDATGLAAAPGLKSIELFDCPMLDEASHRAVEMHPTATKRIAAPPLKAAKATPLVKRRRK